MCDNSLDGSGQFIINQLRAFWEDLPAKLPFGVTSAEVVIIYPDGYIMISAKKQEVNK